jgi:TetR/AcrR family transcriptional regulator, transcriptional repressor for nem operon
MRYDTEHKQRTHEKVVKAAAQAIRAKGPDGVAVAGIMAQAGLTHGGFYAHFASKDDLVAAAIDQMFSESRLRFVRETENRAPRAALSAYLDFYLSTAHRDARRSGCPLAALSSDLPRMSAKARAAFAAGRQRLVHSFGKLLSELNYDAPMDVAQSMYAEMLGALSLARIEPDEKSSDAILRASRDAIRHRFDLEK